MVRVQPASSEKNGLINKGAWTAAEDERLTSYVLKHGHKNWRAIPKMAGLARCGKSCRLRWINYLRPGLKRGNLSKEEEETLIRLHMELGNKWSQIAGHLPGRTDNEIKNIWNTHFKKQFGPKESKPLRKKPRKVPNPSQSVSCSDVASITSSRSIDNIACSTDSSDEKTNILIDLDEYLGDIDFKPWPLDCTSNASNEKPNILIDLDESLFPEDDFELLPTSLCCTLNENSNILIELEEFLGLEDFGLAGNDCETSSSIASWQMAVHNNNNNNQAISSRSDSLCSNACTANNSGLNTELMNVDVLITQLDECLQAMPADQFEILGINDYQISSSSVSLCNNDSTANNNGLDTALMNVDVLITELGECLQAMPADQFEVLGINDCQISSSSVSLCNINDSTANNNGFDTELMNVDVFITELEECLQAMSADQCKVLGINDCQISSPSSVSAQMDCWDLMMDEKEDVVAIGSESWSVLDDAGELVLQ